MVFELARMGDLAAHVAKIARLRYPATAVPEGFEAGFREMASIAIEIIDLARLSMAARDVKGAHRLAEIDRDGIHHLRAHQRVGGATIRDGQHIDTDLTVGADGERNNMQVIEDIRDDEVRLSELRNLTCVLQLDAHRSVAALPYPSPMTAFFTRP